MILKLNGMRRIKGNQMNNIIYKVWFWVGYRCRLFGHYNKLRDESVKRAKIKLQEAFTDELKQKLSDKLNMD